MTGTCHLWWSSMFSRFAFAVVKAVRDFSSAPCARIFSMHAGMKRIVSLISVRETDVSSAATWSVCQLEWSVKVGHLGKACSLVNSYKAANYVYELLMPELFSGASISLSQWCILRIPPPYFQKNFINSPVFFHALHVLDAPGYFILHITR